LLEAMRIEEEQKMEETVEKVLQVKERDAEVVEGEFLRISLHSLAGALAPQTMKLMGKIGSQVVVVVVLIDTGSIHSYGSGRGYPSLPRLLFSSLILSSKSLI
jgi:hypothetical protein